MIVENTLEKWVENCESERKTFGLLSSLEKKGISATNSGIRKDIALSIGNVNIKEAQRYAFCGQKYHYKCNCGKIHNITFRCKSKICPVCAKIKASQKRKELNHIIFECLDKYYEYGYKWRHLTLTLKKNNDIKDQVKNIHKYWKLFLLQLRRKKFKIKGGFVFIEISPNGLTHLHILLYSKYLSQKLLSKMWYKITKNSYIVYISCKKKKEHKKYIAEICKYIIKFSSFSSFGLVKIYKAFYRKRRYFAFGMFYNFKIKKQVNDFVCECGKKIELKDFWKIFTNNSSDLFILIKYLHDY